MAAFWVPSAARWTRESERVRPSSIRDSSARTGPWSVHGATSELTLAGEPRVRIHLSPAEIPRTIGSAGEFTGSMSGQPAPHACIDGRDGQPADRHQLERPALAVLGLHHCFEPDPLALRHRPQFEFYVQRPSHRRKAGRARAWRPLCAGRLGAQGQRAGSYHRAVDRGRDRRAPLGRPGPAPRPSFS